MFPKNKWLVCCSPKHEKLIELWSKLLLTVKLIEGNRREKGWTYFPKHITSLVKHDGESAFAYRCTGMAARNNVDYTTCSSWVNSASILFVHIHLNESKKRKQQFLIQLLCKPTSTNKAETWLKLNRISNEPPAYTWCVLFVITCWNFCVLRWKTILKYCPSWKHRLGKLKVSHQLWLPLTINCYAGIL